MTLKFVNMARLLRIIQYDPAQYMSMQKLNQLSQNAGISGGPGAEKPRDSALQYGIGLASGEKYRQGLIE